MVSLALHVWALLFLAGIALALAVLALAALGYMGAAVAETVAPLLKIAAPFVAAFKRLPSPGWLFLALVISLVLSIMAFMDAQVPGHYQFSFVDYLLVITFVFSLFYALPVAIRYIAKRCGIKE